MNQIAIGNFIEKKRKEQNLTQAQLAEKLGVSNKTVSKWENGKCMPDYGVIQPLCTELGVTVSELMDGEEQAQDSIRAYDDEQVLDLIKRTQALESQRETLVGIILIAMGMALGAMSFTLGGSDVKDFFSGLMMGLSCGSMLVGIFVAVRSIAKRG
ncbi:MAG: helix-turn-helix transcriptional regulator [Oscillospiraceae bacterium]|nr:helix-turn-helix transcriptional regulator [Oscillospiraceae bacterium]